MENFRSPLPLPTKKEPTWKIENGLKVTRLLTYKGRGKKIHVPYLDFGLVQLAPKWGLWGAEVGKDRYQKLGKAPLAIGHSAGTKGDSLTGHKPPHPSTPNSCAAVITSGEQQQ